MTELKLQDRVNTEYGEGEIQYFTYKTDDIIKKMGQYAPIEIDCVTTNVAMNNKVIQVGVKLDNTPERFKTINPEYNGALFFAPNAIEKIGL